MKIAFCAYRDWAKAVLQTVERHPNVSSVVHVYDNLQLESLLGLNQTLMGHVKEQKPEIDVVLFCGWSTPPTKQMVDVGVPMFSEHPATSDRYSPGTPIQNQILDGVSQTKHRIVKVGFPELAPRQWSHEVDMDLSGNMSDILYQMGATSKVLFTRFLDEYPNITWNTWEKVDPERQIPRRTPDMSKISVETLTTSSTRDLYDLIRCLESPYPNAYIEDDFGRLYFERVSYKAKK